VGYFVREIVSTTLVKYMSSGGCHLAVENGSSASSLSGHEMSTDTQNNTSLLPLSQVLANHINTKQDRLRRLSARNALTAAAKPPVGTETTASTSQPPVVMKQEEIE
jgi:hypothetical protein